MFVLDLNICVKIGTYITEKGGGENRFIKNMTIMQTKIGLSSSTCLALSNNKLY